MTKNKIIYSLAFLLFLINGKLSAQVENVPIVHPVYSILNRLDAMGYCGDISLSSIPISKKDIITILTNANKDSNNLDNETFLSLKRYLKEFEVESPSAAVLFYSQSDSEQVFFDRFISNDEKYVYRFKNEKNTVYLSPLFSLEEYTDRQNGKSENVTLGQGGFRLSGTIDHKIGYYLQATNGVVFSGDRAVALKDPKIAQNVKFAKLNSDFDFTESNVRYESDWFYAGIGRESKLIGSGFNQHIFQSTNAPATDAIYLGCRFSGFEYRYSQSSLLDIVDSGAITGPNAEIKDKYLIQHKLSVRPHWGEFSFWEGLVYSGRQTDLAYLNPLSFFKSLEHALHDRDNSLMGFDFTIHPCGKFIIKGAYSLDDMVFSEIGKNYWSNKSAWNLGIGAALPNGFDANLEYARVEPYTFSHSNRSNSYTNDSLSLGGSLPPNSDQISLKIDKWYGARYPFTFWVAYYRAGLNSYDSTGALLTNSGSDPMQSLRWGIDSYRIKFLSGIKDFRLKAGFNFAYEIERNLSIYVDYSANIWGKTTEHFIRLALKINEF